MNYSLNQLKALVQTNPKELVRVVTSPNADTHLLTVGAELLGEVPDERIVLPAFRQLLKHVHALVREGAMTGLASFYSGQEKKPPQDILERLQIMIKNDPSADLKEYANSLLKDFEDLP
jgi:hypothetical protein